MKERVELLDIAVDVASTKDASDATIEYMQQEGSKVVYFFNSETLLLLQDNISWKEAVSNCELILPGAMNVDNSIDEKLGHKRDLFYFERYLDNVLDYVVETGLDILVLTTTKEQFQSVQENIHEKRPYLSLSGLCRDGQDDSAEYLVNEINSVAPDVLFVGGTETGQLELLDQYRDLMNAGVIIFMGNQLYHKAVDDAEVPEHIDRFNLDKLYRFVHKKGRIRGWFNSIRMKVRLKRHDKEKKS